MINVNSDDIRDRLVLKEKTVPKNTIRYWLALKFVPRLAVHKKLQLVKLHGLSSLFEQQDILSSCAMTSTQKSAFNSPDWQKIDSIITASQACNSHIITFDSALYPQLLQQIYDPPLVLFVRGNLELLNKKQLAIVGSRSGTINGRNIAMSIAQELVRLDKVITSGLALGIDAAAHRGALQGQGGTIAVVATGIDRVYPARHKTLANEILDNQGTIVSEFIPGTSPKPGHFPKRNRIISGMSEGVLVVEAEIKSGSLISARCALEQNRDVYAVPGSIGNPLSKGCHWLIKQGAQLVESAADIVNEQVAIPANGQTNKENNDQQDLCNDIILASVGYEVTPVDTVVALSKLPINEAITRLTILGLKGLVSMVPGGYHRLI